MDKVLSEKCGRIAYITLNRLETLNAVDDELDGALWRAWAGFNADEAVDVAIVTGAGKAFCSGADLNTWLPKWDDDSELHDPSEVGLAGEDQDERIVRVHFKVGQESGFF